MNREGERRAAEARAAARLPLRPDERVFFCRYCGKEEHSANVPIGWYLLSRKMSEHTDIGRDSQQRLGLYCTAACLAAIMERIIAIEDDILLAAQEGF